MRQQLLALLFKSDILGVPGDPSDKIEETYNADEARCGDADDGVWVVMFCAGGV